MRIKVDIREDNMGNILATPVRLDVCQLIEEHLREIYSEWATATAFFQEGGPAQAFLAELTPYAQREIENGCTVTPTFDAWSFAHHYGWDTQLVFE